MFTESLRTHLRGKEDVSRQTRYGRRKRIYSRFGETIQTDVPLLLEAIDEGRIDVTDLVADLPTDFEGGGLFETLAELLYELGDAVDGVNPADALDRGIYKRRSDTAREVFDRVLGDPQAAVSLREVKLMADANLIPDQANSMAINRYYQNDSLSGEDLAEIVREVWNTNP